MTWIVDIPRELSASISQSMRAQSEIELQLVDRLTSGRAALPVLPSVASRALELAADPEASIYRFAELVATDPPIAARFLAVANSALYSRGTRVATVQAAVTRIGLANSRDLVFQVVYAATLGGLRRFQREVRTSFQRSVLVGHLSRVANEVLHADCPDAYLCGLLHDIGESRIFRIVSELPLACSNEEALELVHRYHASAGSELARRWRLPNEIVEVCERHVEPGPAATVELRLVRAADLLAPVVEAAASDQEVPLPEADLALLDVSIADAQQIVARGIPYAKAR